MPSPAVPQRLTVHVDGGGGDGLSGQVDGPAHVDSGVLRHHRHQVQRHEPEVMRLLDAGAWGRRWLNQNGKFCGNEMYDICEGKPFCVSFVQQYVSCSGTVEFFFISFKKIVSFDIGMYRIFQSKKIQ